MIEFSEKPIDLKAVKRPKGYNTFTSLKGTSGVYIQKGPVYTDVKNGARTMLSEAVTASVQRNSEFDCYTLFLGSADGKVHPSPYFVKLATQGFKSEGKVKYVGPEQIQQILEAQVSVSTNRILLWKDRPRSAAEKALEKAIEEKTVKLLASEEEVARLRELLTKNKIPLPEKAA